MKTQIVLMSLIVLAVIAVQTSTAGQSGQPETFDSTAAFTRLKTLAGEWQADASMGKVRIQYNVIAGGNTLVEREYVADGPEMMTLYNLDGNRLLLTHHCMLGNQPRMEARAFNSQSGDLRFEFLDITNLKSAGAAHMRNARFRFVDSNRFVSEWELYENGRLKSTETFTFTRTR